MWARKARGSFRKYWSSRMARNKALLNPNVILKRDMAGIICRNEVFRNELDGVFEVFLPEQIG